MNPECIFCKIADGREPAHIVFEDEISVAFLDMRPVYHGHTLLIPKQHISTVMEFPGEFIERFFLNLKLVSRAVEEGMGCQGIFNAINNRISQSVPHLHIHILPRNKGDGMRHFLWPRGCYDTIDEAIATAEKIRLSVRRIRER
ncbi:MAG: HIT family hydrolase [Spirochaetes bacterium GWF1_51_8]|nr:MAG: HIT family hydrolase [Spirochaetes bacterium GWF1_51_8]